AERRPGAGQIVTASGDVIGQHTGVHRFTVGQRRGIGIAQPRPLYVLNIDVKTNRVVVGGEDELLAHEFTAAGVNWIAVDNPSAEVRAEVRVRYRHNAAPAIITPLPENRV